MWLAEERSLEVYMAVDVMMIKLRERSDAPNDARKVPNIWTTNGDWGANE